jgi:ADP-ribosylglycohydrolase
VVRLLRGETKRDGLPVEVFGNLRALYNGTGRHDHLAAVDTLANWSGRSGRGYVVDSFWSAWDSFAGAVNYREAVTSAIRYGNDTDTTACIAGGLAGVHFGLEPTPPEWLTAMRGREIVESLVDRLGSPRLEAEP